MGSYWVLIGLGVLFYAIATESKPEVDRVKIIVPHKINYIHHYHRSKGFPHVKRQKGFYKTSLKSHHVYRTHDDAAIEDEDDIEENYDEGSEETDATKREIVYYAIPAAEFSKNGNNLSVKPVLLYRNDRHHGPRHLTRDKLIGSHSTMYSQEPHRPGRYLDQPFNSLRRPKPNFHKTENVYEYDLEI